MIVSYDHYDYQMRRADEKQEKLGNCHYLLGKYGYLVEQNKGGPKLAEMVRDLEAVLNGTWEHPKPPAA